MFAERCYLILLCDASNYVAYDTNLCSGFELDASTVQQGLTVTHSHAQYHYQEAGQFPLHLLPCSFFAEMFLFSGSLKVRAWLEATMDPRSESMFLNSDLMPTTHRHHLIAELLQLHQPGESCLSAYYADGIFGVFDSSKLQSNSVLRSCLLPFASYQHCVLALDSPQTWGRF